jgi:hypothetical protein
VIQADFAVPASRQDLNQDSPWNQWLVTNLPAMFVRSIDLFRTKATAANDEPSRMSALCSFLRFVPGEDEIVGRMFEHVPRQVLDMLRGEPILPALDPLDATGSQIVWKRPFECVLAADDAKSSDPASTHSPMRQVLTADLLHSHLARYYVHPDLLARISRNAKSMRLLAAMGVRTLATADLLDVLKTVFDSTNDNEPMAATTAKWLLVLHHCLK